VPSNTTPKDRTRLITWEDPTISVNAAQTMSGFDILKAIAAGSLPPPPIAILMNMDLAEVEEGRVIFTVDPAEYHYNPVGAVHGGLAATLVDSAMTCAIYSVAPIGMNYTTIELHVNYIRPITVDTGHIRCIGEVIHLGRRVATAEAKILDTSDKLYAHATTTCLAVQLNQNNR